MAYAFTTLGNGYMRQLINQVQIFEHQPKEMASSTISKTGKKWRALWDTGATNSVITKEIADILGLPVISLTTVSTPQGSFETSMYYVDIGLPNSVLVRKVLVTEGLLSRFDVLIGMDIIGAGDFAVSNFEGSTCFTFRMPSCEKFDFVNKTYSEPIKKTDITPGRNSPCPCGSGKKYKNCHGRL